MATLPNGEPEGRPVNSQNDLTAVLQIITWIAIVIAFITSLVHLRGLLKTLPSINKIHALSIVMITLGIAQAVAISIANANGFGKHIDTLSPSSIDSAFKAQYASEMLYILAISACKIQFASFVWELSPKPLHRRVMLSYACLVLAWCIALVIATAFQCSLPDPWSYLNRNCMDRIAFWNVFGIFNIVSDAGLLFVSCYIMIKLQIKSVAKRLKVASYFGARICIPVAQTVQLVYWNRANPTSDPTFDLWPVIICTQILIATAIITTYTPQIQPFIVSLESGMVRFDDLRRNRTHPNYDNVGYFFSSRKRSQGNAMQQAASTDMRAPAVPRCKGKHVDLIQKRNELSHSQFSMGTYEKKTGSGTGTDEDEKHVSKDFSNADSMTESKDET